MWYDFVKCGTSSFRNAALVVAVIDIILSCVVLILFVLGSTLMLAFEFVGNSENATLVLDEITDDVFGTHPLAYSPRPIECGLFDSMDQDSKDVAEDIGVFMIIMFLAIADLVISCFFLDGIKTWSAVKCQVWCNVRPMILVVFGIVAVINLVYGAPWYRCLSDVAFTLYRVIGLILGYAFLNELRESGEICRFCRIRNAASGREQGEVSSIVQLRDKRNNLKRELRVTPIVTITGPDETGCSSSSIYARKNSPVLERSHKMLVPELKI